MERDKLRSTVSNEIITVGAVNQSEREEQESEEQFFEPITTQEQLDAIIEREREDAIDEYREKAREKNRKKEKERKLRKVKGLFKAIAVLVLISGLILALKNQRIYPIPYYDFSNKEICRDLEKAIYFFDETPKPLPEMAWKGSLPDFMLSDVEYIDSHDCSILYRYKDCEITISKYESSWSMDTRQWQITFDNGIGDKLFWITDDFKELFVTYDNGSLNFYLYDYMFTKISIKEGKRLEKEILSIEPQDLPINLESDKVYSLGDATLVRDGQEFSLWKDGTKKCSYTFDEEIYRFSEEYSIVATRSNKLYGLYVYRCGEYYFEDEFGITAEYIGQVDDASEIYSTPEYSPTLVYEFPKGIKYYFPIFKKDGESYACLPNNIFNYATYSVYNREKVGFLPYAVDFGRTFVKLDEMSFVSAYIYHDYKSIVLDDFSWYADIKLKFNDTVYVTNNFFIDGYDDARVDISREKTEQLTREVFTLSDYWSAVEAIRAEYRKFYQHETVN